MSSRSARMRTRVSMRASSPCIFCTSASTAAVSSCTAWRRSALSERFFCARSRSATRLAYSVSTVSRFFCSTSTWACSSPAEASTVLRSMAAVSRERMSAVMICCSALASASARRSWSTPSPSDVPVSRRARVRPMPRPSAATSPRTYATRMKDESRSRSRCSASTLCSLCAESRSAAPCTPWSFSNKAAICNRSARFSWPNSVIRRSAASAARRCASVCWESVAVSRLPSFAVSTACSMRPAVSSRCAMITLAPSVAPRGSNPRARSSTIRKRLSVCISPQYSAKRPVREHPLPGPCACAILRSYDRPSARHGA